MTCFVAAKNNARNNPSEEKRPFNAVVDDRKDNEELRIRDGYPEKVCVHFVIRNVSCQSRDSKCADCTKYQSDRLT